jgi:hypothetical protein
MRKQRTGEKIQNAVYHQRKEVAMSAIRKRVVGQVNSQTKSCRLNLTVLSSNLVLEKWQKIGRLHTLLSF